MKLDIERLSSRISCGRCPLVGYMKLDIKRLSSRISCGRCPPLSAVVRRCPPAEVFTNLCFSVIIKSVNNLYKLRNEMSV